MDEFSTGSLTFLFTDVEGSTLLWELYPEEMAGAHARQADLIVEAVERCGGRVVRSRGEGDSTFSVFTDPVACVEAACSMQLALHAEKWPQDTPIRVRAALHSGPAEHRDGDYNSTAVNRCARLRSLAAGGQTLLSRAVFDEAACRAPAGVQFVPLGAHRLKDLLQPEQVYQLGHAGLPSSFPPIRSLDTLPTNLPLQSTSFIGRERESAEVCQLLASSRLLTITGAGGAGKTRLSLHVAAERLEAYPAGVWLVELAAVTRPEDVANTIAQAVGIREQPGRTVTDSLIANLGGQALLLVMDNCEHLVAEVARLADRLLRSCASLQILATSREPLGIQGEVTWRLPSLALPPIDTGDGNVLDLEALLQSASGHLFVDRARSAMPGFDLSPQGAPHIARICRRLDGMPLAIELAAARVRVLTVEQIAARLDDRFRLLTGGTRTALPRQQTLRALIDWSYDLLDERERALFRRLAVFSGGWTLEEAEAICGDSSGTLVAGVAQEDVLDLLTALVYKSLVITSDSGGSLRYQFLETVRQYSEEQLNAHDDVDALRRRHASFFLDMAEKAAPHLKDRDQVQWIGRLEADHDNLRTALRWWSAEEDTAEEHLRCAGALARFWMVKGFYEEGLAHARLALGRPVTDSESMQRARAFALNGTGHIAWESSDYDLAATVQQEALSLWQRLGDREGIAISLSGLGSVALTRGEVEPARDYYERSLAMCRELTNPTWEIANLIGLACAAAFQADYDLARAIYQDALDKSVLDGNRHTMAIVLSNLSNIAVRQGQYETARDLCEQALAVHRERGDVSWEAYDMANMAEILARLKQFDRARELHRNALDLNKKMRDRSSIAGNLEGVGYLAADEGKPSVAATLWAAADALRNLIRAPLPQEIRADLDDRIAQIRGELGEETFETAWRDGASMDIDTALDFANRAGLSDGYPA